MDKPEEGLPGEVQSSSDVLEMIAGVDGEISVVKKINEDIADTESDIGCIDNEIDKLRSQIASFESAKKTAMNEREDATNRVAELKKQSVDAPTISSLNERRDSFKSDLDNIEQINEKIRVAEQYLVTEERLACAKMEGEHLTEKIKQLDTLKSDALANATFPLDGLSITDDDIVFKSLSFDDACTSDQIKIAAAIAIAQNPKAKFIFLKNGNILDPENLRILNDYAVEKDFQIVMEYVVAGPENAVGFYIEEGTIVETKPSKAS
jgi:hypothetical protein